MLHHHYPIKFCVIIIVLPFGGSLTLVGPVGVFPNPRGEGVLFGADVTYTFLHENNLRMLVRSHECVPLYVAQTTL